MQVKSKEDLFGLPTIDRSPEDDRAFVEQVWFCAHDAREPTECDHIESRRNRRQLGGKRPKCPEHTETLHWANIYRINRKLYRLHP